MEETREEKQSECGLSVRFRKGSRSCMTSLLKSFEIIATTIDKVTQWELSFRVLGKSSATTSGESC